MAFYCPSVFEGVERVCWVDADKLPQCHRVDHVELLLLFFRRRERVMGR